MDEHWLEDNPFVDPDDPAALERERRRQEREARRQGRSKPAAEPARDEPAARVVSEERSRRPQSEGPRVSKTRPVRPRSPRRRSSRSGSGLRWVLAGAIVVVALVVAWVTWSLIQPFHGEGGDRVNLQIPEGASVGEIANLLEERGVIADSRFFQLRVTLAGKRSEMYPGTYTLREDMSYGEAIEVLSTVPVERTITVTIPEGYSRQQIADLVAEAGMPGDYMKATVKSRRLNPAKYGGAKAENLEGFLFPATYELDADAGAVALVNSQLQAFKDRLAGIGMKRARAANLTVYDVLTIASMIEKEVSVPAERRLVAAVIYNRLREGMPLGIDATTRFAVGNFTEPLTQSQLDSQSPYNTRVHAGLPPGPIGNPGEESIRAAANPAKSDALFYVVKPGTCGEHAFSATMEQFERDVAAYNQAREEAGGRSPTSCP